MADHRMAPPPADRPRMATQLQRAQAEREQPAGEEVDFDEVATPAEARVAVTRRRAAGWEFVPPLAGVGVVAWLTFRRAR